MVCLIGNMNVEVDDVKVSRVFEYFVVEVVNGNGNFMLKVCAQKEVALCNTFFSEEDMCSEGNGRSCG